MRKYNGLKVKPITFDPEFSKNRGMFQFFRKRIQSFGYAFQGIATMIRTQPNVWIHLIVAAIVLSLAYFLGIKIGEWVILIACITLVLAAEAFNTAIEFLTDLASPGFHPLAGKAKDVAAAAVLICAIGTSVIGLIILLPYLLEFM